MGQSQSAGSTVFNSGLILATNDASIANDPTTIRFSHGVHSQGNDTFVTNALGGQIIASGIGKAGVHFGNTSVAATGDGSAILNYGLILSAEGYGVDFFEMHVGESASVLNHGTITGGLASVRGSDATDTVANSGQLDGEVALNAGADFFENTGNVFGDVLLGKGLDIYRGNGNSAVTGEILGGDGDDILLGGQNDDHISGEADADYLRGRLGDDALFGGGGTDVILGNDGDDSIEGNKGNDFLKGGQGQDTIKGGNGDDTITGGKGEDELTGGTGADVFVFNRRSGDDEITDFLNEIDKLDMSAFAVASTQDLTDAGAIIANGTGSIIDLTTLGGDGVIYIADMNVGQWDDTDFMFA